MGVTPREVQDPTELSQEQREVLTGTMLGDGSLAKHGRFHRLFVKHKLARMVPKDIPDLLTARAVAVWLMDDGAADYAGVTFQTHNFSREETHRLAAVLRAEHGLRTLVRANRGAWIVYVAAESVPRLRDLVAPYLLPEFEYKLAPRRFRTP